MYAVILPLLDDETTTEMTKPRTITTAAIASRRQIDRGAGVGWGCVGHGE